MPWLEIQVVAAVVAFGVIVGLIVSYLSARKMKKVETKRVNYLKSKKKARRTV